MHDATQCIEEKMRIHQVTEGVGLHPGQFPALHQGLLGDPLLGLEPGLPMRHLLSPSSMLPSDVVADRTIENNPRASEAAPSCQLPQGVVIPAENGEKTDGGDDGPKRPNGGFGFEQPPLSPLSPFRSIKETQGPGDSDDQGPDQGPEQGRDPHHVVQSGDHEGQSNLNGQLGKCPSGAFVDVSVKFVTGSILEGDAQSLLQLPVVLVGQPLTVVVRGF